MAGFVVPSERWKLDLAIRTQDDLIALVEEIADECRRGCPVDSGEMRESIRTTYTPGVGLVWVGTDHWAPTEYGSEDHEITPKGPGYPLRFFWPVRGDWVAFWRVHHPGTPAQPFMRPALWRRRFVKGRSA